jgi:hypothetical protein
MNQRAHRRRAYANTKYDPEFKMTFQRDYVGKKCRSYEIGCYTCDMWRFFDERGRFPYNFNEQLAYMDSINPERRITYVNQEAT